MKTIMKFVITAAFAVLTLNANAQGNACKKLEQRAQWMKDSLVLTAAQQLKIKEIHAAACVQLQNVKTKTQKNRDSVKLQMQTIMKSLRAEYKKVLTSEQLEKMKQSFSNGKDSGRWGEGKAKGPKVSAEKLKTELDLTDEQTTKVENLHQAMMVKRADLKAKRDSGMDSTETRKLAKAMREEHKAGMKAILTEEQYARWLKLQKSNSKKHKTKD